MDLVGQTVNHKKFGKGVITDLSKNTITVFFSKEQKRFQFPDAFPQYLMMKNNSIQKQLDKLKDERLHMMEKKRKKEQAEAVYRNRVYTLKVTKRSQAAFHISPDKMQKAMTDNFIETGRYLSGQMKGAHRIPSSIQPNSAVILTGCNNSSDEGERQISGIAMVEEHFWGNECKDGKVKLHKQYKFILPAEKELSFWKYFEREAFPERWGSVPYKYFQNLTMQRILLETCKLLSGTKEEGLATSFYHYFCSINKLPEKLQKESKRTRNSDII